MECKKRLYPAQAVRRLIFFVVAAAALLFLGGCGARELEDRSFPLSIGIDKTEEGMALSFDFPDLSESDNEKNPSG